MTLAFDILSNPVASSAEPYRFKDGARLRDYQKRASHVLFAGSPVRDPATGKKTGSARDGIAVHIDPGLGKTIIALTAIAEWFKWGICTKPVLVIAPIKVCETVWRQEARAWSHTAHLTFQLLRGNEKDRAFAVNRPCNVVLCNPEMLVWLQKFIRADWGAYFDALIIDESSMFKDNRTKRFRVLTNYGTKVQLRGPDGKPLKHPITGKSMLVPPHRFKRTGILTGSPRPAGLQNVWAPFYILDHGARLHADYKTFEGRFFHKSHQVAAHVHKIAVNPEEDEERPLWQIVQGTPERIHELIADITVELDAKDYGVLPKMHPPELHYVDLPDHVLPHYRQLEKEAVFEMLADPVLAANGGAKSQMCWQICNGALYATDMFGKREWREIHSAKLDKLVELVDRLDTTSIIPYNFIHDLERITARFRAEGIPFTVLPKKNAEDVIDRWNAGLIPNLLLHPQSAAHGLNLQFGGCNFIWFTTIWSQERWKQTIARLARSGQKGVVSTHVIMARNTTDEVRWNAVNLHGTEEERFRNAVRMYQHHMKLDLGTKTNPFGGIDL